MRAASSEPVNIPDLEKEYNARPPVIESEKVSEGDPALTLIFTIFGSWLLFPSEETYKVNAELRDQFNASRLEIGMTQREVETVLRAKPIESGEVERGSYKIYGSDKSFQAFIFELRYLNILVLYRDGKVVGIYSGEKVKGERSGLLRMFHNFPDMLQLEILNIKPGEKVYQLTP
jgi:hypothetical protein